MTEAQARDRAAAAIQRRYGQSIMPISTRIKPGKVVRAYDPETGYVCEYSFKGSRLSFLRTDHHIN